MSHLYFKLKWLVIFYSFEEGPTRDHLFRVWPFGQHTTKVNCGANHPATLTKSHITASRFYLAADFYLLLILHVLPGGANSEEQ